MGSKTRDREVWRRRLLFLTFFFNTREFFKTTCLLDFLKIKQFKVKYLHFKDAFISYCFFNILCNSNNTVISP